MSREPSIQLRKDHLYNECNRDKVYPYTDAKYVYYTPSKEGGVETTVQDALDSLTATTVDTPDGQTIDVDALKAEIYAEVERRINEATRGAIKWSDIDHVEESGLLQVEHGAAYGTRLQVDNLSYFNRGNNGEFVIGRALVVNGDTTIGNQQNNNTLTVNGNVTSNGTITGAGVYDSTQDTTQNG